MSTQVQKLLARAEHFTHSNYPREAIKCYLQLIQLIGAHWEVFFRLGDAYRAVGDFESAQNYYLKSKELAPDKTFPICRLAWIAERRGLLNEAHDLVHELVFVDRAHVNALTMWATIQRRLGKSEETIPIITEALKQDRSAEELSLLHYVLGQNSEAIQDYSQAFFHFKKANEYRGQTYDPQQRTAQTERLLTVPSLAPLHRSPLPVTPVLIVGFMRSGSTVLEQALGRHPQISICGEHQALGAIAEQVPRQLGFHSDWPEASAKFSAAQALQVANLYLSEMGKVGTNPQGTFIVDKTLTNYKLIDFALRILPNVKIINCVRDPLDTCLSCFVTNFTQDHAFSTRLDWLGHEYLLYQKLMAKYQDRAEVHTIHYESLVSSPREELQKALAFLSVEWEEACLSPEQNDRVVATASYAQVKKPFHRGSVDRAQKYYEELYPLRMALGLD